MEKDNKCSLLSINLRIVIQEVENIKILGDKTVVFLLWEDSVTFVKQLIEIYSCKAIGLPGYCLSDTNVY